MWNVWRNPQTRVQFIVAFNVFVGLIWFRCYKEMEEARELRSITAPGSYNTKEDLEAAGFDVVDVNRKMLESRALRTFRLH